MKKIVLLAFEGKEMCFVHVLANALDMEEKGYDVKVILEGEATATAAALGKGGNFHELYMKVKDRGLIDCACKACSMKMNAYDTLAEQGIPFKGEMMGHPSIADYIKRGYEIITF
ncbi:MAG: DsrE family protein [Spirochaetales bacterium]|nr:DsrE family protein [Spirochaetales bacterium]